jgi:hypothetical protein
MTKLLVHQKVTVKMNLSPFVPSVEVMSQISGRSFTASRSALVSVGFSGKLAGVAGKLGCAASLGQSHGRVVIQSDVSNQPTHFERRGM